MPQGQPQKKKPYQHKPRKIGSIRIKNTREVLKRVGKQFVKYVREEITKDFRLRGWSPSVRLLDSFYYSADSTQVYVYSTWVNIDALMNGVGSYPLTGLSRAKGYTNVPIWQKDGSVEFRALPSLGGKAWVHPGFAKVMFLNRAKKRLSRWVLLELLPTLQEL